MNEFKWIFVTGAPRSGTTFVGKMMSLGLKTIYIHEPFNPDCGINGIDKQFTYVMRNDTAMDEIVKPVFDLTLKLKTGLYREDSRLLKIIKRIIGSRGPVHLRFAKLNFLKEAGIIKDPIGCLMTEYLFERFGVKPIILIRHPVAFVSSMLRLGWESHVKDLYDNADLKENFPHAFSGRIDFRTLNPHGEYALEWNILYSILLSQFRRNSDCWKFVRHEDVCNNPVNLFKELYEWAGLPWTNSTAKRIEKSTSPENRVEARKGKVQDFRRDSRSLFRLRLESLNQKQRQEIFEITKETSVGWYDEESFAI